MSYKLTAGVLGSRKVGLLPADNTFAWYDAEKVTTAINEPVTFLVDRSENGYDAVQNGVNPVPDLQVDANGNKCLRYIDDVELYRALISDFGATVAQPVTYFVVLTAVASAVISGTRSIMDGRTSTQRNFVGFNISTIGGVDDLILFAGSNARAINNRPIEKSIYRIEFNTNNSDSFQNQTQLHDGANPGTQPVEGITIGSRFEGSSAVRPHVGNIYELIIYNRILAEQEKEQTYNYLKSKYNIAF